VNTISNDGFSRRTFLRVAGGALGGAWLTLDLAKVAQAAQPAAEWIGDSAVRVRQTQDQMVTSARDYIRERPLITLGVALAAGYLIGRIGR